LLVQRDRDRYVAHPFSKLSIHECVDPCSSVTCAVPGDECVVSTGCFDGVCGVSVKANGTTCGSITTPSACMSGVCTGVPSPVGLR
jgi:hypothetical protein